MEIEDTYVILSKLFCLFQFLMRKGKTEKELTEIKLSECNDLSFTIKEALLIIIETWSELK